MPKINNSIPASGSLPKNYREVLYWRISEKPARTNLALILMLLSLVIFGGIFGGLAIGLGRLPLPGKFGLSEIGSMVGVILLTAVFHELVHGLGMRLFGARPQYGVLWKELVFYVGSPGYAYRRNSYVAIVLAPFVCISILVVLGMWLWRGTFWVALLGICGVINAGGAVGDIWIAWIVLRYAAGAYIMAAQDGVRVFLPKP